MIKAESFKVINSKDEVAFNSKLPDVKIFTQNGTTQTWTKPAGVTMVYIEVIGGGGGFDHATDGKGGGVVVIMLRVRIVSVTKVVVLFLLRVAEEVVVQTV